MTLNPETPLPELPDITIYIEALRARVLGHPISELVVRSPFLVRTYDPALDTIVDRAVTDVERLGKRIVFVFDDELFLVFHLMIAGRFQWRELAKGVPGGRNVLAAFTFPSGILVMTEAGTKKRASLHLVKGREALAELAPDGLEIFDSTDAEITARLMAKNHTLKRALTDPRLLSGIGNAYSDEILHRARLSPILWTHRLKEEQQQRLVEAIRCVLDEWIVRLRAESGDRFPAKVTAFRKEMAVHGRHGEACPDCGTTVQRIRYASNETNYCPRCQTDGKMLRDRALSRLLKEDWPSTVEEWEATRP